MTINNTIEKLIKLETTIDIERKNQLNDLAEKIIPIKTNLGYVNLLAVCTHNSRRSQLCEYWINTICQYYKTKDIYAYSGGSESTAFNHRMVTGLNHFGAKLFPISKTNNPIYLSASNLNQSSPILFSKKYDDQYNPHNNLIAIMVCDHADKNCPIINGCALRFSLQYIDPKFSDNTTSETEVYQNKVLEIGKEIHYLLRSINNPLYIDKK